MARLKPKACGNIVVRIGKYIFYHRGDGKPLEFSRGEEGRMFYDWYAPVCSQCKTCVHVSEHAIQYWLESFLESEEYRDSYEKAKEKAIELAHLFQGDQNVLPSLARGDGRDAPGKRLRWRPPLPVLRAAGGCGDRQMTTSLQASPAPPPASTLRGRRQRVTTSNRRSTSPAVFTSQRGRYQFHRKTTGYT